MKVSLEMLEDKILLSEEVTKEELLQLKLIDMQRLTVTCFGGVLKGNTKDKLSDRILLEIKRSA